MSKIPSLPDEATPGQTEKLGTTFWREARSGYALLSYISDPDDWAKIINNISMHLSSASGDGHCNILDIGSGVGVTTFRIMQRLLSSHSTTSSAVLIEPSQEARHFSKMLFPLGGGSFCGVRSFDDLSRLGGNEKFDSILYIHSSYYISDLRSEISGLIENKLKENGCIIFLVLSEGSGFFLGRTAHGHRNCADSVKSTLASLGMKVSASKLTSRINVPPGIWDEDEVVRDWKHFIAYEGSSEELKRKLRTYLVDGLNLGDELILARKQ